jgi:lipopolysaccharide export system protein LptA
MKRNWFAGQARRLPRFAVMASGALALQFLAIADEPVASNVTVTAREPTVITSDRLEVDYLHNLGTFEGNVLAVDPRITVRADKAVVFYSGRDETSGVRGVQRVLATGGVVITQGDRKATGEQAEYFAGEGKVVLTGKPQVTGKEGTISGEKITFWRDQEKMDVEAGTRLILYPDAPRKEPAPQP